MASNSIFFDMFEMTGGGEKKMFWKTKGGKKKLFYKYKLESKT